MVIQRWFVLQEGRIAFDIASANGCSEIAKLVASQEVSLLEAAASGEIQKAFKALEAGANVNCRDQATQNAGQMHVLLSTATPFA